VPSPVRVPLGALDRRGRTVVDTEAGPVAVFLVDGRPFAVANRCPHEGNPLVLGNVAGTTLQCTFHQWRFDLETGACLHGDRPATTYPAELEGETIVIALR
jgi:nitrite reductase/ring-hydroxylating ferredoxin subunit